MDSYRTALEVGKWLEPLDVVKSYGKVGALFRRVAAAEELWLTFILAVQPDFRRHNSSEEPAQAYYWRECIKKLPELSCETLKLHYLPTCQQVIRLLSRPIRLDPESVYLLLPDDRVFLCGGALNLTYLIDSVTGTVAESAPMLVERSNPGLISIEKSVYVFGGQRRGDSLRRAEKWQNDWRDLPKMSFGHYSFSPCRLDASVFLFTSAGCEVFKVRIEAFSALELRLGIAHAGVITGIVHNQLVLVSKNTVMRIAVKGSVRLLNSTCMKNLNFPRCLPAVSLHHDLYFLESKGICSVNGNTLRVTTYHPH